MNELVYKISEKALISEGVDPHDEDSLLRFLDEASDASLIWKATIMLRSVGTDKSVPTLKKLMFFPKADIKITSFHALASILKEDGQDLYVEFLEDSKYPEKFTAISVIDDYCDCRAAKSVLARVRKIMNGKRNAVRYSGPMSELTTCLRYLTRIEASEREEAYQLVRDNTELLESAELSWINEHIGGLLN